MAKKQPKQIEEMVDQHYEEMFDWLTHNQDDNLYELKVIVKLSGDGKTIRRSWKDREKWLGEEN
jgi:hypothetical protein